MRTKGFDYLKKITAVDYPDHLTVVYILYNMKTKEDEVVTVNLPAGKPEIDSVMAVYAAADWYEREMSEMFGIRIKGRKAARLLLEEWNGVDPPLRKTFVWGRDYRKMQ